MNDRTQLTTHYPTEVDQEAAKAQPAKIARRRGRPPGAKTQVSYGHISADEFSFLRAVAQGIDLMVAARQYLRWPGRTPERPVMHRLYSELLERIEASAPSIADKRAARAAVADLINLQTVFDAEEAPQSALSPLEGVLDAAEPRPAPRPTLDEFAARFDQDMFSEQELLELYEEEFPSASTGPAAASAATANAGSVPRASNQHAHPLAPPPATALSGAARVHKLLGAIDWLAERLSPVPDRGHRLEQWIRLNPKQRQAMNEAGVITLGNFVDWISLTGPSWYEKMPGYGARRADSLLAWFSQWQIVPSQGLDPVADRSIPQVIQPKAGALVPLSAMRWPEHLRGHDGRFRSAGENLIRAQDDLEAMRAWLLVTEPSGETLRAYRRAIERLALWAIHERGKALSSLDTMDLLEFREFLLNPPAHWVQGSVPKAAKASGEWRPLRGPLSAKGLHLTFAAIKSMYRHWHRSSYLSHNPAEQIKGPKFEQVTMDVMRSFSEQHLEVIGQTFASLEDGPVKRRLMAILRLLENAGLRRAEVASVKWGDLARARVEGRDTQSWVLRVLGKGGRVREVPLNANVMEALWAHRNDRQALVESGALSLFARVKEDELPLIGVLDQRWIDAMDKKLLAGIMNQRQLQAHGHNAQGAASYTVNLNGGMSASAIYQELKEFFRKCAVTAGEDPNDKRSVFRRASTHWLRHTYAHHALKASGESLTLVMQLLGHSFVTTTQIYLKAEMKDRVATNESLKSAV